MDHNCGRGQLHPDPLFRHGHRGSKWLLLWQPQSKIVCALKSYCVLDYYNYNQNVSTIVSKHIAMWYYDLHTVVLHWDSDKLLMIHVIEWRSFIRLQPVWDKVEGNGIHWNPYISFLMLMFEMNFEFLSHTIIHDMKWNTQLILFTFGPKGFFSKIIKYIYPLDTIQNCHCFFY